MNAIAEEEGFEVEIKPMDFKGIIPAITANQLDGAIAGISITDERKKSWISRTPIIRPVCP